MATMQDDSKIHKDKILDFLKTRSNYGCHPGLGRSGILSRLSQVRENNRRVFKVGISYEGAPPDYALISPETFNKRGLSLSHPAVQVGAPVFLVHEKKLRRKVEVLFLKRPEEMLLLLRLNLFYLQQVSDEESERLTKEFLGINLAQLRTVPELCDSLIKLKNRSARHFLKILEDSTNKKVVLEAADRGEIMQVASQNRLLADDLGDSDIAFLKNVVRARYMGRLGVLKKGNEEFSELGRKIFGQSKEPFNRFERQALMTLAIAVTTDSDLDPASSKSGRWLMRKK